MFWDAASLRAGHRALLPGRTENRAEPAVRNRVARQPVLQVVPGRLADADAAMVPATLARSQVGSTGAAGSEAAEVSDDAQALTPEAGQGECGARD